MLRFGKLQIRKNMQNLLRSVHWHFRRWYYFLLKAKFCNKIKAHKPTFMSDKQKNSVHRILSRKLNCRPSKWFSPSIDSFQPKPSIWLYIFVKKQCQKPHFGFSVNRRKSLWLILYQLTILNQVCMTWHFLEKSIRA